MERTEILVQLDNDTLDRLDKMTRSRGVDRSELLQRAVQAVIESEELIDADAELVRAYRHQPPDPILVDAASRLADRTHLRGSPQ